MSDYDFDLLLARLCDEEPLTDGEFAWLAARLESDEAARAEYIRMRDQEANLRWAFSGATEDIPLRAIEGPVARLAAPQPSILDRASRRPVPPSLAVAMMVTAAVLFLLALWPVSQWLMTEDKAAPVVEQPVPREYVARIVRSVGAEWSDRETFRDRFGVVASGEAEGEDIKVNLGSKLFVGQSLYLNGGVAEIYFDNGAEIILQGPAVIKIQTPSATELAFGKLVGHCPVEGAKGFAVHTPWGEVVDIGTEFGVDVARSKATEVAVFSGEVVFHPADNPGDAQDLGAGEALRIDVSGKTTRSSAAEGPSFVRRINGQWQGLPNIVAAYQRDFVAADQGQPASQGNWRYYWNPDRPVGDPAHYQPLVWNSEFGYCPSADRFPLDGPGRYARLSSDGGHPGVGGQQTGSAGIDRYVIATYRVPEPGQYEIVNSRAKFVNDFPDKKQSLRVVVHVDEQDALLNLAIPKNVPQVFDLSIGPLEMNQVIYVAIGPDGNAGNDQFQWDFQIMRTDQSEP